MDENTTTDVPTLVSKMKNHRFDGYSPVLIAAQIDWIRSGPGTDSINSAVDALQQVGTALTETEDTLRTELGKLGVSWHGAGSVAAGAAVSDEAGFSNAMATRLQDTSRALFAQGDAFNRTRAKLPDAGQVRKATGETDLGDDLLSLIGFETDHASRLARAREAWHYAVQVLNEYCMESAGHLESTQRGAEPEALEFAVKSRTSTGIDAGRAPADADADADAMPLVAGAPVSTSTDTAGTGEPAPAGFTPGGHSAGRSTPPAGFVAPTSRAGSPVTDSASTSTSGTAAPAASAAPSAADGGHGGFGGSGTRGGFAGSGGHADPRPVSAGPSGGETAAVTPGQAGTRLNGRLGVPAPGAQSPAGGVADKPYTPLSPVTGGEAGHGAQLARGRMSGLAAQPTSDGGYTGGVSAMRATSGMSATDLGAGAAAVGAGGVAGAMSGDSERQSGSLGRSAPSAGEREDGEAEAAAAERVEAGENDDPAAVPDGEPAAER